MNVTGRKALILGGTSGIGLSAARQLLARHAQVVVMGRDEARLSRALEAVKHWTRGGPS